MSATRNLAVILAVILGSSGLALAQATGPTEEVKRWKPLIGKWVNQEEQRDGPEDPWQKVPSEWEIRWVPGSFFIETPGKMVFADREEGAWQQIWGYDPEKKQHFGTWFNEAGGIGKHTFKWTGTTLEVEGIDFSFDGTEAKTRCTYEYSSNYTAQNGKCEHLTDGQWWVFRKITGSKQ
jgi:hypothetical protein